MLQGPTATYENMSTDELDALLLEMEPDIRAADRDMREIELLEQKGVLSARKLAGTRIFLSPSRRANEHCCSDHEALHPQLQAFLAAQEQDVRLAAALEKRIATLVERHTTHVSCLLFQCQSHYPFF